MSRPIRAIVSVAAMRHNLRAARLYAPGAKIWAVVKANAYGHGLDAAMAGFADADGWALLEWDKAIALRRSAPAKPILMLEGPFARSDLATAATNELEIVLHSPNQIEWAQTCADLPDASLSVWVKVNSTINRLGLPGSEVDAACARLQALPHVRRVGLITHFANADRAGVEDTTLEEFRRICAATPGPRSAANSAAVMSMPDAHVDWVRPGVMLYGASPFGDRAASELGLLPAMRLESALIATRPLARGDSVGYGSTFTADRPMRIGVVACGYADGYPRHAQTGTPVFVAGIRTRLVGRVSMDMLTVDLEPAPHARVGSPVQLWGERVPIDEVAAAAGTIGYELMCAVSERVTRVIEPLPEA